jgi:putative DNA primase/helicase
MELDEFVGRLGGVRALPSGTSARCPAHDDHVASLMVNAGKHGGIVLYCHAGCTPEAITAALGLTMMDLAGTPHVQASYVYTTEDGVPCYTVERWANPKTFRINPAGVHAAHRVLYQLPAITWARQHGQVVYVVEGEKDADRMHAQLGLVATTNVGGAGKWLPQYTEALRGCHVVIIADDDVPGRAHARAVADVLAPVTASLALTVPAYGNDVSDLLDAGYDLGSLRPLTAIEPIGIFNAALVRTRSVDWAWPGYIALGKLSMLEGDPGDGKSTLTIDLAARWSTGRPLPDGTNGKGPWPVVMVSAEDDPEDTIVPRLRAAGANLSIVELVTHGARADLPFDLTVDLPALKASVKRTGARIVVLDPLSAFLGERTDSHNDHSVRRALYPLKLMAAETEAAVVIVRHLNKSTGGKAIYRGGGSIGFSAAARAAYGVGPAPDDPDKTKIFICVKNNLARKPAAMRYALDFAGEYVTVSWLGPVDAQAEAVLDGVSGKAAGRDPQVVKRVRAEEQAFLFEVVKARPLAWKEIVTVGKDAGYSAGTLLRAREDLGLTKIFGPGGNRDVTWGLPEPSPEDVTEGETHVSKNAFSATWKEQREHLAPDQLNKWAGGGDAASTSVDLQGVAGTSTTEGEANVPTFSDDQALGVPSAISTEQKMNKRESGIDAASRSLPPLPPSSLRAPKPCLYTGCTATAHRRPSGQYWCEAHLPSPPPEPDAQRDEALRVLPVACDVCGQDNAIRWFGPHWVIRCRAHNPLTYKGVAP